MTFDRRYSSTVPAPLEGLAGDSSAAPLVETPPAHDYAAVAAAGDELTAIVARFRAAFDLLCANKSLQAHETSPLARCIDDLTRVAMQGRLLDRVASGAIRHKPEQLALDQLLVQLLDAKRDRLREMAGVERTVGPASVVADRDLLTALIDVALDWAIAPGLLLTVSLQVKDWPAHALLRIATGGNRGNTAASDLGQERLSWYLVQELARAVGVGLDRVRSDDQVLLMLEFPRTVREIDGLVAMEVDLGRPAPGDDSGRALAGHRALIISSDIKLREDVKRVCRDMGLEADNVPSAFLAAQRCESEPPDLLIVDERFNDEQFQQLLARLQGQRGPLAVVEVTYAALPGMQPGWGDSGITRVARTDIAAQMPQALALELAKLT